MQTLLSRSLQQCIDKMSKLTLNSWPEGTPDFVNHRIICDYIQDTSRKTGVHFKTIYNTRVERVAKAGQLWKVQSSTLEKARGNLYSPHVHFHDWVSLRAHGSVYQDVFH